MSSKTLNRKKGNIMNKKFKTLLIVLCVFFCLSSFAEATKWVRCGRTKHAVQENEAFSAFGSEVYYANMNHLVIVNNRGRVVKCINIGPGWQMKRYKTVLTNKNSSSETIVFVIAREGEYRYFNVKTGDEVTIDTEPTINKEKVAYSLEQEEQGERPDVYIIQPDENQGDNFLPIVQEWTGEQSQIKEEEYHRITSRQDWKKLWKRHMGKGTAEPRVDFNRYMVVGIFMGQQLSVTGTKVLRIERINQYQEQSGKYKRYVNFDFYPMLAFGDNTNSYPTEPFGIYVIEKTRRPLVIRKNIQFETGSTPKWVHMKTFPKQ